MNMEDSLVLMPKFEGWQSARIFIKFLKVFMMPLENFWFIVRNHKYTILFWQLCTIEQTLNKICKSNDAKLLSMKSNMNVKFQQYWGASIGQT